MNAIKAAQAALSAKRASGDLVRRTPLEKTLLNPKSLRLAINAKCWDCQGGDSDPCVQWRIGNCEISDCALFKVRPHQRLWGSTTPKALRFSNCGFDSSNM